MISPIFMVLTIISGIMVVTAVHPVHSIIWLVLSFVGAAIVFIQLQADFIALATLIIYVGAIAILFIFVLMMLNLSSFEFDNSISSIIPLGIISVLGLITLILGLEYSNINDLEVEEILVKELLDIQTLGFQLYTSYAPHLIVASLILLVAMIGAIILTLQPHLTAKRQDNFIQISRDSYNIPKNRNNSNY
uniref:NADH-ubiquinone oxidoreductase chain 6 n=1 Tax=Aurelia limbata TaxID=184213 RepID=A0A6G6CGF7_9CNID|nr:NADH dehydrogenase subunit 6 [Aurelia limbata]QID91293.1 NADH dehydrogenase subunit 6 [Aurelia limbata]